MLASNVTLRYRLNAKRSRSVPTTALRRIVLSSSSAQDGVTVVTNISLDLTRYIYICRVMTMTRDRKCSNQTLALLTALAEQPRVWRHGYDLSSETGLKSGTLYPILMRLSDRGLLDSKWTSQEGAGRPPRHMYRLTAQGTAFARQQLATCATAASLATPRRSPA